MEPLGDSGCGLELDESRLPRDSLLANGFCSDCSCEDEVLGRGRSIQRTAKIDRGGEGRDEEDEGAEAKTEANYNHPPWKLPLNLFIII
jgi:hypothetical protein